jgi:hypothetical protein
MSISSPSPAHPLLAAIRAVDGALDEVASMDPLFASIQEKAQLLC